MVYVYSNLWVRALRRRGRHDRFVLTRELSGSRGSLNAHLCVL